MPGRSTIILLEDDLGLRGLIADGLRDHHYTVIETGTVDAAAQAIHDLDGHAILVADRSVGTRPPNGFDAAAEALARYPALKAVYMSGTHIAIRHRQLSCRERSLLKPFALAQLVTEVRHLEG